jgi:8-oxo-dGTP diphosphatase
MPSKKIIHVAVGVIERISDKAGKEILISKRHLDAHQGGLWEFPGGKVENDESLPSALARELEEELGLKVDLSLSQALSPLIQIFHDYGDKAVLLDVWRVTVFTDAPEDGIGKEGQQVKWVNVNELKAFTFPVANVPIITACQLPGQYAITPGYSSVSEAKIGLKALVNQSAGLILFRQPALRISEYFSWLEELLAVLPELRPRLMLSANCADLSGATHSEFCQSIERYEGQVKGVHYTSRLAKKLGARPIGSDLLMAVSCHSLEELKHAQVLTADFVTLSPIRNTPSHPDAVSLGWSQFRDWVKLATVPVYALGGMKISDLEQCLQMGGQGIAGISAWAD